jgi:hypothetical protein
LVNAGGGTTNKMLAVGDTLLGGRVVAGMRENSPSRLFNPIRCVVTRWEYMGHAFMSVSMPLIVRKGFDSSAVVKLDVNNT